MNLFNTYIMRSCGEAKFQPKTKSVAATFAVIDWFKERNLYGYIFGGRSESEINKMMEEIRDRIQLAEPIH